MNTSQESQEPGKGRIGLLEGEFLQMCKEGEGDEYCIGVNCTMYRICYEKLNPNTEGYFIKRVTN